MTKRPIALMAITDPLGVAGALFAVADYLTRLDGTSPWIKIETSSENAGKLLWLEQVNKQFRFIAIPKDESPKL